MVDLYQHRLLLDAWIKGIKQQGETFMKNFWMNEEGQGMVEYGLIIALVAIVVIVGLKALGGKANTLFNGVSNELKLGS
jgi:pilus assembly protein Flp/PilA